MIAYDTTFKDRSLNIPIIRLVTENTVEHALVYETFVNQNFSYSHLERIVNFGLNKNKQEVEAGCELSKFDIQGTCDKVFHWIDEGMSNDLTFGMEAAVENDKDWGPPRPRFIRTGNGKELASVKAEKRVSEFSDEGNFKKRKVRFF